ncbi:MAG: hypothetical protein KJ970_08740 [Candidatus Eisenbacteria bacterium]|uniref:4Fe-4S ferredoxin-type domain-containing protein n=1 Tax=Eiseniibacteriota bacterium TaxID=2212470 RepID=A0A948RWT6_UNCEI|nr:hypothetical protein [Candidatus Eisenbacteria bacterium]MBU1951267.1 hypothetical protein [Candidatus Eisenbacteria bacterium]MBU2691003.1 hypothetical protein [Candidatus Eisenbacteria bacterium]
MDIPYFGRGIHIPKQKPVGDILEIPPPDKVFLLLQQCAGPICVPVVEAGDTVKIGQLVAEGAKGQAPDLHSPICGIVKGLEDVIAPNGTVTKALVVESNGGFEMETFEPDPDPLSKSGAELLEEIRKAGIVTSRREAHSLEALIREAMDPHGFVSATGSVIARPVRQIAVRFTDVDPHLATLKTITREIGEKTDRLHLGLKVLQKITGTKDLHFVLDRNQDAPGLVQLAEDNEYSILRVNAGTYPSAADPLVACAIGGREPDVAFRGVHESGELVLDVDTVLRVARAVAERRPVLDRLITVGGSFGVKVVKIYIGMTLADIAEAAGETEEYGKVLVGGPLQGSALHTLDFPMAKDSTAIWLFRPEEVVEEVNHPCISCGLCVMVCPMRLLPGLLSRYCEFGKWQEAEEAHLFSCIECGCCSYVCPAERSMVQFMVHGKNEVLALWRSR